MVDSFDACWLRIDRAEEHRREAAGVWNAFLDRHPFTTSLLHLGDGRHVFRIHQEEPTPAVMPVLIGEWAYNLRAALDYVVYETAVIASDRKPPPNAGKLQFPVFDDPKRFAASRQSLRPLADHHLDLLELMQPYRHEDHETSALRWLNRIAREDRHRQLSVLTAYAAELRPITAVPQGCQVHLEFGSRSLVDGVAEVCHFTVSPWQDGMEVSVNPQVGLDPDIEGWADSPFWRRIPYNERLRIIESVPVSMVATFEYDCLGRSRKEDWLTEEFRAQADARRPSWLPSSEGAGT